MNTFGSLKYLEAESSVVEELIVNLKDQLNKLKIEELAIRAAIRRRLKEEQEIPSALDSRLGASQLTQGNECSRQVQERNQIASTSRPISNIAEQSDSDMRDAQQVSRQTFVVVTQSPFLHCFLDLTGVLAHSFTHSPTPSLDSSISQSINQSIIQSMNQRINRRTTNVYDTYAQWGIPPEVVTF